MMRKMDVVSARKQALKRLSRYDASNSGNVSANQFTMHYPTNARHVSHTRIELQKS